MALHLARIALLVLSFGLSVSAFGQTTVTLREGLNGYTGTRDDDILSSLPDTNRGSLNNWSLNWQTGAGLIKFAIFAAEGGPVPNGATITSATLSVWQNDGPSSTWEARRLLKNWNELQATWNTAATGLPWQTPGALGATDIAATAEGQTTITTIPGWLSFNVTSSVQAFGTGTTNYGWRVGWVTGTTGAKTFFTREYLTDTTHRPTLTITYTVTSNSSAVMQDGVNAYAGTRDNDIASSIPDTNRGSLNNWSLNWQTGAGLIKFAIFASEGGPVPNGSTITSATLSVWQNDGPGSTWEARRLLKNWQEMQATWNIAATGLSWQTSGAQGASDIAATADSQTTMSGSPGWLSFDVTPSVQAFSTGTANYGWRVGWVTGTTGAKTFFTRNYVQNPSLRPKLTVTWTPAGTCTPPTAQLVASPNSGTPPLSVTFNASGSTDGSSPITSLRLQFGDGQEVTWTDKNQNQSYTYTGTGSYSASLTATNSCGSSAAAIQTIVVTNTPVPPTAGLSATPSSGSAPLAVTFSAATSQQGTGSITSLRLQFGYNNQEVTWSDKNITQSFTYTAAGMYSATLTVTDSNNLSSSATAVITVTSSGEILPSTPDAQQAGIGKAVATFHSMSLYYNPASAPSGGQIWMRYRRSTESAWREGWPLWYDSRDSSSGPLLPYAYKARGSAVYLQPGTKYFFEFGTGSSYANANWLHYVEGTTWQDPLPENPVTSPIGTDPSTNTITVGGTASAYKVYDGQNNTINNSTAKQCLRITASFVIVRHINVQGCNEYGISIAPSITNVVIEDSDISDWDHCIGGNKTGFGDYGCDERGGIHLEGSNSSIVVQRNKIHDPNHGAYPWDFGHPHGSTPIFINHGGGQNVIRYNEIYSTLDIHHWMYDGMMGTDNFSGDGFPGADSDIYHNNIRNVMDDGIEAEGGGRNVRVWGNYIDQTYVGIATTVAHFGPIYIFRNVINRARRNHMTTYPDEDGWDRGPGFKAFGRGTPTGSAPFYGGGRQYFFHNTLLQQPGSTYTPTQNLDLGVGGDGGMYGANDDGANAGMRQSWSRNNILHTYRSTAWSIKVGTDNRDSTSSRNNWFDYDLYNCCFTIDNVNSIAPGTTLNAGTLGTNFVHAVPVYKSGQGWNAGPKFTYEGGTGVGVGNFQLQGPAGVGAGQPIPNFSYGIDNMTLAGKSGVAGGTGNPDMGAHDSGTGTASMLFGLPAAGP